MPSLRNRPSAPPTRAQNGVQLPPADPTVSYAERAITAWLDAQLAAYESQDVQAELDAVLVRLGYAGNWFAEHGKDDPQYDRAYRLRAELEKQERWCRIQRWSRWQRCWTACKDAFSALAYLTPSQRAEWLQEHVAGLEQLDTPVALWQRLHGSLTPPGAWPPEPDESSVRAGRIETWHRTDYEKQLDRRRKRANRG
jgi:hypothetical protein